MLSKVKLFYRYCLKNFPIFLSACLVTQALILKPSYEAALFLLPVALLAGFNEFTKWQIKRQVILIRSQESKNELDTLRSQVNQLRLAQTYSQAPAKEAQPRRMF